MFLILVGAGMVIYFEFYYPKATSEEEEEMRQEKDEAKQIKRGMPGWQSTLKWGKIGKDQQPKGKSELTAKRNIVAGSSSGAKLTKRKQTAKTDAQSTSQGKLKRDFSDGKSSKMISLKHGGSCLKVRFFSYTKKS